MKRKPIPLFYITGGFRPFIWPWWKQILKWVFFAGWWRDLRTYWYRARYGWAPRDTWSFDTYLCDVLGYGLEYLAEHKHGTPIGYPDPNGGETTDHEQWVADLKRWASAFRENPHDVDIYDAPYYEKHNAEEKRRSENIHQALKEMEPWFESLWD